MEDLNLPLNHPKKDVILEILKVQEYKPHFEFDDFEEEPINKLKSCAICPLKDSCQLWSSPKIQL